MASDAPPPPPESPLADSAKADADRSFLDHARRLFDSALAPICVVIIALSIGLVLTFDYGRDQAIYALVAREMLHGKMPYRDAFDFKPPGIFMVYALARAIFGGAQYGIRVLEAISMIVSAVGLVRLAKVHFNDAKAGFVAAALASQVHAQLDFWHTGQPESFGGSITIVALVIASHALGFKPSDATDDRPALSISWRASLLFVAVGALFGFAGLMKPPLAGGGAIVAVAASIHVWTRRDKSIPLRENARRLALDVAKPLVATAIGGVLPIALVLLWFKSKGALGDLHEVLFVFTPFYTKLSWEGQSFYPMAYFGVTEWLTGYSSALFGGLVAALVFRPKPRELWLVVTVTALIVVHIGGVVMQGKFFPYHWGATFPLTAILAGYGFNRMLRWANDLSPIAWCFGVLGIAFIAMFKDPVPNLETFSDRSLRRLHLFVTGPMDRAERDKLASVADVDMGQNRAVAEYVKANTKPGDFLFVWGFECIIYDLADRPIASRYIYDVPQRAIWSRDAMQPALMAELERNVPESIVVEKGDVFPQVTGDRYDSAGALYSFRALRDMLDADYHFGATIGDFDVYFRDHEPKPRPPPEPQDGEDDAP